MDDGNLIEEMKDEIEIEIALSMIRKKAGFSNGKKCRREKD